MEKGKEGDSRVTWRTSGHSDDGGTLQSLKPKKDWGEKKEARSSGNVTEAVCLRRDSPSTLTFSTVRFIKGHSRTHHSAPRRAELSARRSLRLAVSSDASRYSPARPTSSSSSSAVPRLQVPLFLGKRSRLPLECL